MSKLVTAAHHIALKCHGAAEFEKVLAFYCGVLGLEAVRRWGDPETPGAMIDTGNGTMLEINANAADAPGQGALRHIALATPSADACAEAVERAGYPVFLGPKDIVIGSRPPLPARIAFCHGPVGEEVEFFQEL